MSDDPYELHRFVDAQDAGATYDRALAELRRGRKTSHWMWFVFPQLAGLGHSAMAQRYAISSIDEARAYLTHPVLGPRLLDCVSAVAAHTDLGAEQLLGPVDAQKLRSCLTLFRQAGPDQVIFARVLADFFDGVADAATDARL